MQLPQARGYRGSSLFCGTTSGRSKHCALLTLETLMGRVSSPATTHAFDDRQGSLGRRSYEEGRRRVGQPHPAPGSCRMTVQYPIVFESETSGAASAYVPGLPVLRGCGQPREAERAIRGVLTAFLNAHPGARSHAQRAECQESAALTNERPPWWTPSETGSGPERQIGTASASLARPVESSESSSARPGRPRVHAAPRIPSSRRSQPKIRFQLANVWVTILSSALSPGAKYLKKGGVAVRLDRFPLNAIPSGRNSC